MRATKSTGLLILALVVLLPLSVRSQAPAAPYKITSIKALLYYEQTGTFSKDILSDPNYVLWNVIIAGEEASSSTLVLVEVSGQAGSLMTNRKVEFTATYELPGRGGQRATTVRRTSEIGILSERGRFFAPFWLYDTGCSPVAISARLLGQSPASSMKARIGFQCGE